MSTGALGLFVLRASEKTELYMMATFYLLGKRPQDNTLTLLCCFRPRSRWLLQPSLAAHPLRGNDETAADPRPTWVPTDGCTRV